MVLAYSLAGSERGDLPSAAKAIMHLRWKLK